ncbi:Bifunctional NAD(P)H-hydrate repair enzyme Nnr [Caulifigura coniformis]|uniref:NAD(P)H-hydrate epimerase n=1 Tax=Caulifigura coniformis TaxID=2527983 RepID=A0A517SCW9_9PLAN|nr:NAD(P)H-hydrate epimerase [Caulifigura coniformis]QDT53969.1 Bifunctional NAD(P)H-hydrate repair enzyme Nnr [Caulifigura coniformis]
MKKSFLTRDEVRDVDRRAIEEYGLPGVVLMENAGRRCSELIDAGPVVICCGRGNNGGDGFVIARHLENRGFAVEIVAVASVEQLRGDARINADVASKAGIPITVASQPAEWAALAPRLDRARWIVDALLGTGFSGELREPYIAAIQTINNSSGAMTKVLAVDVPSGLDVETGTAAAHCIKADVTATFVAMKRGFFEGSAKPFLGRVEVVDIGVPRNLLTSLGLGKE